MAIFRKIHTSFWSDSFVSELEKEKKLFYLYLLTNERTRQCGVYEITKKQIAYDLGYTIDTVSKQLEYFIKKGKVKYNEGTNELAIGNWLKYNSSTSPKVQLCINKEFKLVKDTVLIEYVKSIDTHPQEEEEEQEEEKVKGGTHLFTNSIYFDKKEFAAALPEWSKEKLKYYYAAAVDYSAQGNKYKDWIAAVRSWERKDEKQGKLKFNVVTYSSSAHDGIL
jgi:hypothetical protein